MDRQLRSIVGHTTEHFCVQRTHKQLAFLWQTMVFTDKVFMLHKTFTGRGSQKSRLLLKILMSVSRY
jgi:hypothetical protein